MIATDVIPVVIDTINNFSAVNRTMVQYLEVLNRYPNVDNTIDVEFKLNFVKQSVNCIINDESPILISMGLTTLLGMGIEIKLHGSSVCGKRNMTVQNNQPQRNERQHTVKKHNKFSAQARLNRSRQQAQKQNRNRNHCQYQPQNQIPNHVHSNVQNIALSEPNNNQFLPFAENTAHIEKIETQKHEQSNVPIKSNTSIHSITISNNNTHPIMQTNVKTNSNMEIDEETEALLLNE